jgi:hypothetical protein
LFLFPLFVALALALLVVIVVVGLLDGRVSGCEDIMLLVLLGLCVRREQREKAVDLVNGLGLRVVRAVAEGEYRWRGEMVGTEGLAGLGVDRLRGGDGSERAFGQN